LADRFAKDSAVAEQRDVQGQSAVVYADVQAAAERLRGVAHATPVHASRTFDAASGVQTWFKCEQFQDRKSTRLNSSHRL